MTQNHIFIHLHNGDIIDNNFAATDARLQSFVDIKNDPRADARLSFIPSWTPDKNMVYYHIEKRFIKKIVWEFNAEFTRRITKFEVSGEIEFPKLQLDKELSMQVMYYINKTIGDK